MTIEFNCPNCDALIAFDNKHAGQTATCVNCQQKFIIPSQSYAKAQKVIPPVPIEDRTPQPGFWKALFIDSWKLFIDPENAKVLVFIGAFTVFKFFLAHGFCCVGVVSNFIIWGWLFGIYLNIVSETAFDCDQMPDIYLGNSVTFLWYIIGPMLKFVFTAVLALFPFIISLSFLQYEGLTIENMWTHPSQWRYLLQATFLMGVFIFPMALLISAVANDFLMIFRPDYVFVPIFRALLPYLTIFILLTGTCLLEWHTKQYQLYKDDISTLTWSGHLALNLALQVMAIISMRSIGLFYRHYKCYLLW